MYNIFDIANWFISKGNISQKKLQRLVYYSYAWYLTLMNEKENELFERLFEEKPEAWMHGPTYPCLYEKYKHYGSDPIDSNVETIKFNEDTEDILNQIWDVYGQYNGNELESIACQEDPWINARKNSSPLESSCNNIEDEEIFNYYIKQADYED